MKARKRLVVPILIIVVGVAWLLNVMGVIPGVDWIWTGCLAAAGILTLALGGVNKLTVVVGPFLIVASVCSILRQTGRLPIDYEIPILTILIGCLLLLAYVLDLPTPDILKPDRENG